MARRFVRSQRNGMSFSDGNKAPITCGIVSPMMMQNASIPPYALYPLETSLSWNILTKPIAPKILQSYLVSQNSAVLSLERSLLRSFWS
jgi:hypothetical protein